MIELNYDLEVDKIINEINKTKSHVVLLHLPDGLKPKAKSLQEQIESKTDCQIIIWGGSNFGACDLPVDSGRAGIDLIIHFGHSAWLS